jgi:hypothetical protein
VVCVNPASLVGGSSLLEPYFNLTPQQRAATGLKTPWVEYPDLYSASCQSSGGATWLQADDVGTASDQRPRISETLGPTWGFHLYDVNLAWATWWATSKPKSRPTRPSHTEDGHGAIPPSWSRQA